MCYISTQQHPTERPFSSVSVVPHRVLRVCRKYYLYSRSDWTGVLGPHDDHDGHHGMEVVPRIPNYTQFHNKRTPEAWRRVETHRKCMWLVYVGLCSRCCGVGAEMTEFVRNARNSVGLLAVVANNEKKRAGGCACTNFGVRIIMRYDALSDVVRLFSTGWSESKAKYYQRPQTRCDDVSDFVCACVTFGWDLTGCRKNLPQTKNCSMLDFIWLWDPYDKHRYTFDLGYKTELNEHATKAYI